MRLKRMVVAIDPTLSHKNENPTIAGFFYALNVYATHSYKLPA